jgi:hypothetical protein
VSRKWTNQRANCALLKVSNRASNFAGLVFISTGAENGGLCMSIWTVLFVILLLAWIGGFTVFHVASALIHLLLIFAVVSLILHFVMGARAA